MHLLPRLKLSCAAGVAFLTVLAAPAHAADRYHTIATGMARCAAMGYSQTAAEVSTLQGIYNPATLFTSTSTEDDAFDLWLDPVGIYTASQSKSKLSQAHSCSAWDWLNRAGLFVRALGGRYAAFAFAGILTESLPGNPLLNNSSDRFPVQGVLDWQFSQALMRIRMAEAFSIGASLYMVTARGQAGDLRKFGGSYGVLLRPAKAWRVGIMYVDVPDETAALFLAWNRTIDEAMNVGITFQAQKNLLLSLDVRNVSEENQTIKRELHAGLEWQPFSWLAVRNGYFRMSELKTSVYAAGIGLCSLRRSFSPRQGWFDLDFTLDYGLQIEKSAQARHTIHFLTVGILL